MLKQTGFNLFANCKNCSQAEIDCQAENYIYLNRLAHHMAPLYSWPKYPPKILNFSKHGGFFGHSN